MRCLALAALLLVLTACPTRPNGLYCTDTCEDPLICDVFGIVGPPNTCVTAPSPECSGDTECNSTAKPICDSPGFNVCRECRNNGECVARDISAPVCGDDGECSNRCEASTDCADVQPICTDNLCGACATDDQCKMRNADRPYCDAPACAECLNDTDCTDASKPACHRDTGTCGPCTANSQCESNVCDRESGLCVDPARVLYVDQAAAAGDGSCSRAMPCQQIADAMAKLSATADVIRVIGDATVRYEENLPTINNQSVSFHGDGAAIVGRRNMPTMPGDTFTVIDGSTLIIQGLTITSVNTAVFDGIQCQELTASPEVRLLEVTIADNLGVGIAGDGCTLTLRRSTIQYNQGGGISLENSSFTLVNNFIVYNGTDQGTGSAVGGIKIDNTKGPRDPQIVAFNTVYRNESRANTVDGVECTLAGGTALFLGNIVYAKKNADVLASNENCPWSYSLIEDLDTLTGVVATNSSGTAPTLVNPDHPVPGSRDFHLMADSAGIDFIPLGMEAAAAYSVDIENDVRPRGCGWDVGADETAPSEPPPQCTSSLTGAEAVDSHLVSQ
ncbi:MAG: right-handed parallel beta-helix repeat-containing protein [Proteobacteria bacterium]|nr:right-handed parallel beta-helix repeat-containing protein [Pseudomonadota bacterium]